MANSPRLLPTDCEHYQTLISAELDGELTGGERAELQSHLQTCPECLEFRAACRNLTWDLAVAHVEAPSAATAARPAPLPRVNGHSHGPLAETAANLREEPLGKPQPLRPQQTSWISNPWFWGAIAAGLMLAVVVSASWQLRQPARPQFPLDPLLVRYANNVEAEEDQQATLKLVQMDLRTMRLELNRLNLDPETRRQLEQRIASLLAITSQLTQTTPTPQGDLR